MANIYTSADQLIGKTPLLELRHIEQAQGLQARILAKLEYFNPAGSVKDRVALQGNLDPAVLLSDEKTVREEARLVLDAYGPVGQGGHVFNLGHGVDLNTPVELVQALVDEVHHYSRQYHI